jgi:hypothetical protein
MADGDFIARAIKHPGAFSKQAEAAGKSTGAYAQEKKGASGVTGRRARLALTLAKLRKRKR